MNRNYSIFLSYAGPDKESIAIPLYERLRERNIHAFLDREELHVGDNGPRVMEYAINIAPVGVFILSPEFAARNWTMAELMCFQKREREALESNRPLPLLIPVFYRLDIPTGRNETKLFRAKNESSDSAFLVETRAVEHAADKSIARASGTVMGSEVERDSFAPHFDVWQNPTYVYLPVQLSNDPVGSHSPGVDTRDIILQEGLAGPTLRIAIQGMPVSVTERSIFKMAIDLSKDYDRAISLYYDLQSKLRSAVIGHCTDDEYMSLTTKLHVSTSILDSTRSEDDVARTSYSWAEMHRSLCVLKKQQWVPVTMLCQLWNTASYEDADFIADMLSEIGLVDVQFRKIDDIEVKGVQLHDVVHDIATRNAMNANEGSSWHVRLLQGYASRDENSLPMRDDCRK